MITGWLSPEGCPDCDGPLLETPADSTGSRFLILDCPGCGYHARVLTTPDDDPGETEAE
jgi:hypothetical protein